MDRSAAPLVAVWSVAVAASALLFVAISRLALAGPIETLVALFLAISLASFLRAAWTMTAEALAARS